MTWNYRLIKIGNLICFAEVFFTQRNKPFAYVALTDNGDESYIRNEAKKLLIDPDLHDDYDCITSGLQAPILDYKRDFSHTYLGRIVSETICKI